MYDLIVNNIFWVLGVVLAALFVGILLVFLSYKRIDIKEFEVGLLYKKGRYVKLLLPGRNRFWRFTHEVVVLDKRPETVVLAVQEILTIDPIAVKVSGVVLYEIIDPPLAIHQIKNLNQVVYLQSQLVLRDVVSTYSIEELQKKRVEVEEKMLKNLTEDLSKYGIKAHFVKMRDIVLPGELKKANTEVVRAQKEGQAALERARSESAAMRNLANTARMLDNNPSLLYLRVLQSLTPKPGSMGNTLVWGVPTEVGIGVKNKASTSTDDAVHSIDEII